ncbi:MAG: hypothetical protein ACJ797_01395, partial [Ktedonobacteraceae bacterium]
IKHATNPVVLTRVYEVGHLKPRCDGLRTVGRVLAAPFFAPGFLSRFTELAARTRGLRWAFDVSFPCAGVSWRASSGC